MKAKGTIFKSVNDYVSLKHSSQYGAWKARLSAESIVMVTKTKEASWYSIKDALIEPTEIIAELLNVDVNKLAWEIGRFSAERGLTGIYKVFMAVSTPAFILKRAPRIMTTFYAPSQLSITKSTSKGIVVECLELPVKSHLIENRIAGWIEKAGELCGCINMKVAITDSLAEGADSFIINASWD